MPKRIILAVIAAAISLLLAPLAASAQGYPDYERTSLYVPVRDGTRLAVNIYRPADADGVETDPLPVVFVFTPYRARFYDADGNIEETALNDRLGLRSLIRAGYVVAVADIRGKGASFGRRRGFQDRTEAQDGHDLVEWLADQPFSTGRIGMLGCSYLGGTVMHTASTTPPSLQAAFIGATDWDKYDFVRRGGITAQFNSRPDEPLSDDLASVPVDADPDGVLLREAVAQHADNDSMSGLWYSMPYRDSVTPLTGTAYWQEVEIFRYAEAIREAGIATYFWSNWEDEPTSHVLVASHNMDGRLLVGPGSHCVPPPGFDFTGEITRFFDAELRDADNGFEDQPRVTYWQDEGAGEGHWERTDTTPGVGSQTLSYYLGGQAAMGSPGTLAPHAGAPSESSFAVDFDVAAGEYFAFWPATNSAHGLVFESAPMEQDIDLLGYPVANLAVSADREDADVFVYLEQLVPGADAPEVLSFSRLKLSHRATAQAPWDNMGLPWHSGLSGDVAPLPVGEVAQLSIAMMPVSRHIPAGTRLRVVVTGADPRQRNLAEVTLDPPPVLTVHGGWEAGSRIDLPVRRIGQPEQVAGQIGEPAGRGSYPAVAQARADAPGYTIYRPLLLPDEPMPVVLWGNGACRDNGLSAAHALREIASHGYLVIANGTPREERAPLAQLPLPPSQERVLPPVPDRPADETTTTQLLAGIDWAEAANADPSDPLHGRIDTSRVAVLGHSCGGLQALSAGADPRVDTVIAFGSGVYVGADGGLSGVGIAKDDLNLLHTPVAYILGGETDIAFPNGSDDFARIGHVPVMLANYPVGHSGTLPLANGGEWARVGALWLDWQLRGDAAAAAEFVGADCGLCRTPGWTIERKQFP